MDTPQSIDYFQIKLESLKNKIVLPLESSLEVLKQPQEEICPIAGVAAVLLGVINYRGRLLWIVDLSRLLQPSLPPKKYKINEKLTIIVIKNNQQQIGCLISELEGIISLDPNQFKPIVSVNKNYLKSQTKIESQLISLLDIEAIFTQLHHSLLKQQNYMVKK